MKRILVTGSTGFIGVNAIEYFVRSGFEVLGIDKDAPRRKTDQQGQFEKVNILNRSRLRSTVRDFDPHYIVHLAARTDMYGSCLADYKENIEGVQNVVDVALGCTQLTRIVFASSRMVCRTGYVPKHDLDYCPDHPYGESKVAGENIVRNYDTSVLPWVIARPTSIWGPHFGVPYNGFFKAVASGMYFHPGNAEIKKSFGYVGNSVYQLDKLTTREPDNPLGKTYYIADYQPLDVYQWATLIAKETGRRSVIRVPTSVLRLVAWIGDAIEAMGMENMPLTSFRLKNLQTEMIYDLEATEGFVGELPYTTEDGVRETVAWMTSAAAS